MAAVVVEGLRKSYGDNEAVRDISLTVDEGEIVGILGPNGSGKTTTVECIQGLRRPDTGRIDVLGVDPRHDERALRRLWDLIAALRDRGTTVVLVTHFMDEAERLCDRLYVVGAAGCSPKERRAI